MKMAGATEVAIAEQVGVSKTQVHNDIQRRLAEVRRDDKKAVQKEYNLQRSRYERLLLRWWSEAIGPDDSQAERATKVVLDILRRLDTIGGLVPDKPLIQLNQDNRQIMEKGSIRIEIGDITEAFKVLADVGAVRMEATPPYRNGTVDGLYPPQANA